MTDEETPREQQRSYTPTDPMVYLRDAIGMADDDYEQGVLNRAHNQILKYRRGELEIGPEDDE